MRLNSTEAEIVEVDHVWCLFVNQVWWFGVSWQTMVVWCLFVNQVWCWFGCGGVDLVVVGVGGVDLDLVVGLVDLKFGCGFGGFGCGFGGDNIGLEVAMVWFGGFGGGAGFVAVVVWVW
ncbi:hypothetical protein Ddye_003911 [Dipteronia dyeriana]|uniref:Transmembrane protein n=1 Tax=Dipteronia dyeriana TaxID=168575 RepID=A0AAE0CVR4_9ROSI|nr:hypothetical protein Ddye_003911 [Dipteronia dyeriana]